MQRSVLRNTCICSLQNAMILYFIIQYIDNYNPSNIFARAQFLKPMDNKHNSLNLAAKICSDICPWTLSVPRSSQFSSSFALGTDNVHGQISEHIFAPNEGYCLFTFSLY